MGSPATTTFSPLALYPAPERFETLQRRDFLGRTAVFSGQIQLNRLVSPLTGRVSNLERGCVGKGWRSFVLINEDRRRHVLRRIAYRLTAEVVFGEDLIREATVRLCFAEEQRARQSRCWSLQTCKFKLDHCTRVGRSVDSVNLRHAEVSLYTTNSDERTGIEDVRFVQRTDDCLTARGILDLFGVHATDFETEIHTCLARQLGPHEIASRIAKLAGPWVISRLPKRPHNAILPSTNRRR
jgi:hypothetical protein